MAKIESFQDLIAWQEARILTREIYLLCKQVVEKKDFGLENQMKRAAVSVMANIAEGFGRHGLKESKQFYIQARGSLAETQSHLFLAQDLGYCSNSQFSELFARSVTVNKLINGLINATLKCISRSKQDN